MTVAAPTVHMYDLLAKDLKRFGVEHVFTFTSEDVARLVAVLDREGVRIHFTRHEHIAVGMADGYARASGNLGVAIVGRGPGLTNALNALTNASKAGSGILVICGGWGEDEAAGAPLSPGAALKHVDQPMLLRGLSVRHTDLGKAEQVRLRLASCVTEARGGATVVASVRAEVVNALIPETLDASAPALTAEPPASRPTEQATSEIADVLEATFAARSPVILAGRGAVRAGARDELLRLGEAIGALFGTSLRARAFFRGSAHDLGVIGTFATPVASELMAQADLVLAFGASLNPFTTYQGSLLRKAQVIQFDIDESAVGRHHPAALHVVADARLAAAALADELARRGHRAEGFRRANVLERLASPPSEDVAPDRGAPGALDPRLLFRALDRILPRNRMVVADAGVHAYNGVKYLGVDFPDAFAWTIDYAAIGCGLGVAMGAAVARPDRPTVLVIGDAALMMTLADLDTAVRDRLPLVVLVGDDGAVGAELLMLRRSGLPEHTARVANPDFAQVARALGADAYAIDTLDDVPGLSPCLERLRGPLLVACRVMTWRDQPAMPS